jgi:hypothetical protein
MGRRREGWASRVFAVFPLLGQTDTQSCVDSCYVLSAFLASDLPDTLLLFFMQSSVRCCPHDPPREALNETETHCIKPDGMEQTHQG